MAEQVVSLQVAKASEADMRALLDVVNIIEAMAKGWMPEIQNDEGEDDKPDDEIFDEDDPEHCRHAVAMLLRADERGGLFRAAFGLTVLLNPKNELVDPDLDHIAKHPKIISALAAQASTCWQPIATAPKTGRTLLLGYVNCAGNWRTVRGQWMSADYIEQNWEDSESPEGSEGWYETSAEADDAPNCWPITPTHWMPTPPEPNAATSRQPSQENGGDAQ